MAIKKILFLTFVICALSFTVFAKTPDLIFSSGDWIKEGDVVFTKIDASDIDFASAYFTESRDSFYFETDFTIEDSINPSRWLAVSYRTNEDKTLSHMLRIKQKTSLGNGIELTFLNEDRWRRQNTNSGKDTLEIGKKYNLKMAVSGDYLIALLNDAPLIITKIASNVESGLVGLHSNGVSVKFENIILKDYIASEMIIFEQIAEWQAGRERAAQYPTFPLIVAHRGNSSEAPENTMAAVKSAILAGADGVEIDVYLTLDGEVMLLHDGTLQRTTNGTGDIRNKTSEYLSTLDAGSWFNRKFAGEAVPFLRDVLLEIKDKVTLVIETKMFGVEDKILELLDETGTRDQVVIISFIPESLARFHDIAPDIPTSVLLYSATSVDEIVKLAARAKTRSVDLGYGICTKENVSYLASRGYSVWAWTVDDVKTMENLVLNGVSVITTNVPRKALDKFRPLPIE